MRFRLMHVFSVCQEENSGFCRLVAVTQLPGSTVARSYQSQRPQPTWKMQHTQIMLNDDTTMVNHFPINLNHVED